ncbi:MAG: hypothetical protein KAJ58_02630 [Candidatus Pacebacteria bacterium]|nr:hypothetical protein [Candidatus Paceibacterota bacterium]
MQKYKKDNKQLLFMGVLILILGALLYSNYNKKQNGFLQINSLDETLVIYIDNNEETSKNDINPEFKIKKGIHSVIVYKEGHWPWTKEVEILGEETLEINPFFISQNTSGFIIEKADSEYWNILAMFRKNLISEEALNTISSIEIKDQITAIDFYKNREDVVLMALTDGIYALGVDYKTEQNLQPIYKGKSPSFVKKDDNNIYILDNNNLMEVSY